MKKLSKFLCLVALVMLGQSAWAAAGDKTTLDVTWSRDGLDYVTGTEGVNRHFVRTESNGLVTLTFAGGDNNMYYTNKYHAGWGSSEARLQLSDCKNSQRKDYVLSWAKPAGQVGYSIKANYVKMLVAQVGSYGDFHLSDTRVTTDNAFGGQSTAETVNIPDSDHVDCYFTRGGGAAVGSFCCLTKFEVQFNITPNAPTWITTADDVTVTVNHTQDSYLHWIDLSSYLQVGNDAFKGTVKYEAVGLDAKYVVWNAAHDKCYIVKPGTYEFRAYIDKKAGAYCASAYTATNLVLTATADAAEQNVAQVFYFVDDVMATEYDMTNHYWTVNIPWTAENKHYVEYVYAYTGAYQFVRQTTHGIKYLSDTDPASDHFNVLCAGTMDTTEIKIDGAHHSWLELNATKADNHVTFTINSQTMYNALMTSVSHYEGDDVFWDNNRIRFAHFDNEYSRKRQLEITFTGVPDSLIMLYGNNSQWQSSNAAMLIEYCVKGSWNELTTIHGRPNSTDDHPVRFAYRVPAGANQLRFSYSGAQNLAFIHDLTVTERKGIEMSVAMDSVLEFSGVRQKGGVDIKYPTLSWYNLYPSMYDTLVNYNADRFQADLVGLKPLALDDFEENHQVSIALKLDSAGVFSTHYMVWNGRADMSSDIPGGKKVYGFLLHGIVKYGDKDLHLENTLPSDTISMHKGDLLDNPFQVKDSSGNIITDSLHYDYDFFPENAAEIDPETGKIKANCVGYTRVIATLKENKLIPAGITDTIYIYVPEAERNEIIWNIPAEVGRGDTLTDLATTADGAKITYAFAPEYATALAGNKIVIADTVTGNMLVTAYASATCDHMKMDSAKIIKILDKIEDEDLKVKDPDSLKNLLPGDSIKDLVVVIDPQTGDTLLPPAVTTTYRFEPDSAAKIVDGSIIVISHAVDPILVIATTKGPNIKTRIDTIYLHVQHDWEEIAFTDKMLDTMLVGTKYALGGYITTKSGNGADTLYVADSLAAKALFHQGQRTVTPLDSALVEIFAVANGNKDYHGPASTSHIVRFVYGLKPITWEQQLEDKGIDLNDIRVKEDTIPMSDVKIYDNSGKDITDELTKDYKFIPTGMAEVTEDGDIVMTQAGDVDVIITTSGPGFETRKDTLHLHAEGYQISRVDLNVDLSNLHIGDTVALNDVKVYDKDGEDITETQVESIGYKIDPAGAAKYDAATNSLVILQAGDFDIIPLVYGALLDPNPATDTIHTSATGYEVGEVKLNIQLDDVHVGDTIPMNGVQVLDKDGNDITESQVDNITYIVKPSDAAKFDPATNSLIVLKDTTFQLVAKVEGKNLDPNPAYDTIDVDVKTYEGLHVEFPELPYGEDYLPGDTIDLGDIKITDKNGKDITELCDQKITWEPKENAHLEGDKLIIDKAGELEVKVEVSGEGIQPLEHTEEISIEQFEVAKIEYPAAPEGGYHVGDIITTDDIILKDADGNDITDQADITYSFVPTDGAHLDKDGNIVIDKSGNVIIQTNIQGGKNVAPYNDEEEIYVKKYETSEIIIPEKPADDYNVGDKIQKDEIQIKDKDGNDITDDATITYTFDPADAAHVDTKGNLIFDKPGKITVTTTVSGEGITEMTRTDVYIIRHDEKGCKDLIAQVWNDVLAVNNNKETHVKLGIDQFVSYQWYREEEKLAGETAQDYHISAGEFQGEAYYYAYAYDMNGKEYMLCEILVKESAQPAASTSFKIYPNMVAAGGKYTIEVAQAGTIYMTTSNGNAVTSFEINKGMTDYLAPAAPGVYMLQYVPKDGKYEVLKLIVK